MSERPINCNHDTGELQDTASSAPGEDGECPKCGGETTFGYGLAGGGGSGVYFMCLEDDCDYFHKDEDK